MDCVSVLTLTAHRRKSQLTNEEPVDLLYPSGKQKHHFVPRNPQFSMDLVQI